MKNLLKIILLSLLCIALIVSIVITISLKTNQNAGQTFLDAISNMNASVSAGVNTGAGKVLNVFSIKPEMYFQITAPIFKILPLSPLNPISPISLTEDLTEDFTNILRKNSIPVDSPLTSPFLKDKYATNPAQALVNIFCSQKISTSSSNGKISTLRRTITGSGILINKDGSVLTNAHVAQFPLLSEKNKNVTCLARYGNPAIGSLPMKVAFISPEWIKTYGQYVNTEGIPQSGKSDFAIIKLVLDNNNLLLPIKIEDSLIKPSVGASVTAVAYPADILGKKGINSSLILEKEKLSLQKIYSVGTVQNDVLETGPTSIGQKGSSGGALVNDSDKLIGVISMITGSSKNIRAMSTDHIDAELSRYARKNLGDLVRYGSFDVQKDFDTKYRDYLGDLLNSYIK